jgi:four helix bundle protein
MSFRRIEDIRAWHLARQFKLGIYRLIDSGALAKNRNLEEQLREAAASAPSNISEGFGRFDPADFGRLVKVARASIIECKNHLIDAVDGGLITEEMRLQHDAVAEEAMKETAGLLDYLQSPEAKRNAERIRQRRIERRRMRRNTEQGTTNREPRTVTENTNLEPGTGNEER